MTLESRPLTQHSKVALSLGTVLALAGGLVVGTLRVQAAATDTIRVAVAESVQREHQQRIDSLAHYVTRDEWLEWRRSDAVQQERRYYALLAAINALGRRRR